MATAKKLPSGSWRCRVYSHTEEIILPDGTKKEKMIYKSFTCDDPSAKGRRKCEAEAAAWAANKEHKITDTKLTLGQAIDKYVADHENILSIRTLNEYKRYRNKYMQSLIDIRVDMITQKQLQVAVNTEAAKLSPKTVANIHGLFSMIIKQYNPGIAIRTDLPKKKRAELYVPTDAEIKKLIDMVKGTNMELPVLLAAFGPMRRGEICALESSDINGNIVHVSKNMVKTADKENPWMIKTPKSYAGDRYIEYPDFVAEKWRGKTGRIVDLCPDTVTKNFILLLKNSGMPHFRFHDLRHYSASILHALGIPDMYIMQRGGWGDNRTLNAVYRHALSDKTQEVNKVANDHFSKLYDTKYDTK